MESVREKALRLLDYDPKTGVAHWKVSSGRRKAGCSAGWVNNKKSTNQQMRISIGGQKYLFHRIVWLMKTGEWPIEIDHINGDASDNRWENLREVNHIENHRNRPINKNNTSGIIGVSQTCDGKWAAQITVNGKNKSLYCGRSLEKAVAARDAANHKYGFHKNHGERRCNGY